MTIHTNTFPLQLQHAANTPSLLLTVSVVHGKYSAYLYRKDKPEHKDHVNCTALFTESQLSRIVYMPQPIRINLIDNDSFKHMLDCLSPKDPILL